MREPTDQEPAGQEQADQEPTGPSGWRGGIRTAWKRFRASQASHTAIAIMLARLVPQGLGFLLLPFYSRMLAPDDYGRIAVFLTWATLFLNLAVLSLHAAISRAWFEFDERQVARFISSISFLACLLAIAVTLILLPVPGMWFERYAGISKIWMLAAVVAGLMNYAIESRLAIWVVQYDYKRYFLLSAGLAVLQAIVSVALLLMWESGLLARFTGIALPLLLVGGVTLGLLLAHSRAWTDRKHWSYALTYCLPLVPHTVAGLVMVQFDRVMLASMLDVGEAGIYTFGAQVGEIATVVCMASNTAWVPWFFEQMTVREHERIATTAWRYVLLISCLWGGLLLIGPIVTLVLAPQPYWGAAVVTPVAMLNGYLFVLYSLYANVEFFEKRTGWISVGTLVAAVLNIALNLLLIPRFGYLGAAWATAVGNLALFLIHAAIVIHVLKPARMFAFWRLTLLAMLAIGLAAAVSIASQRWLDNLDLAVR